MLELQKVAEIHVFKPAILLLMQYMAQNQSKNNTFKC